MENNYRIMEQKEIDYLVEVMQSDIIMEQQAIDKLVSVLRGPSLR